MIFEKLHKNIFSITNEDEFNDISLHLYELQLKNNPIYAQFVALTSNSAPCHYSEIPFLPIDFFKTKKILLDNFSAKDFFVSSGTTGTNASKHYITDFSLYEKSFLEGFRHFFGSPEDYCLMALLPNYMEQQHSSLIYMIRRLIKESKHPNSGFYLNDKISLTANLEKIDKQSKKVILFGVTYALLDLVEFHPFHLKNTLVFETGGMKGRRRELVREELHSLLCKGFGVDKIYSEYGMTELFSQAYSMGGGVFECPPWLKILIRQINNPLAIEKQGKTGGVNVIDLANIYSCPFIATQDLGFLHNDHSFEILGRFDHSDTRGCNLMIK